MTRPELAPATSDSFSPPRWLIEPFVMGTPRQFAQMRETLVRIGFTESQICERAGVATIHDLVSGADDVAPADALAAAISLFIEGTVIPWTEVTAAFDETAMEAFRALGLLVPMVTDPDLCIASVALYPVESVYIASDRRRDITRVATALPADLVYTPLTEQAREFLHFMPRSPCEDYLELCCGTGIAALVAARQFAKHSWGVDITERSARFARFNASLNGLEDRTSMLEGDLYAPVDGLAFDMISAHPPYVPSLTTEMVYRDGGEDGEQVTRRVLAGLADHLRPGGVFYCDCMLTDRTDRPAELRIREMLGPSESAFDVILVQLHEYDVEGQNSRQVEEGTLTAEAAAHLAARFRALNVERFVGVAVLVHRRLPSVDRPPITVRQYGSSSTTGGHLEWYLRWCLLAPELEREADRVLDARPRCVDDTELRSRSVLRDARWAIADVTLVAHAPFEAQAPCPAWCATFLTWCDGSATVREHLQRLRHAEAIPDSVQDSEFATFVRQLAGAGFVELDLCPLPRASASSVSAS